MPTRSFTVFQDSQPTDVPAAKSAPPLARQTSILGTKLALSSSLISVNADDKENLHPVTGERNASSGSKKRKTTVLAVKAVALASTKKEKGLKEKVNKEAAPEEASPPKKRKSSSSSSTKSKLSSKKDVKKDSRSSSSIRKRATRKAPSMPKVDEEADPEPTQTQPSQAEIDSRCYDLTVKPLADVSRAYDESASLETLVGEEENVKLQNLKASTVEPEACEPFISPPQSATLPLSPRHTSPAPSSKEPCTFSTPERKRIYTAFTFISPSPTGKRFGELNRVTDIPPLEIALRETS